MARYTGPTCRQCRRERMRICEKRHCATEKRPYPPGEHGRGRIRETEYLLQLREKQKARRIYGVLEKQFRNYYTKATRRQGLPVRGQRTKTNARTRKGPKRTVAGKKKAR